MQPCRLLFNNTMRLSLSSFEWKQVPETVRHASTQAWWLVLCGLFVLCIVIFGVFGARLFWKVHKDTLIERPPQNQKGVTTIDRDSLSRIVTYFNTKRSDFEFFKTNPPHIQEPSL